MLTKVIKHDFMFSRRTYVLMGATLIGAAIIARISISLTNETGDALVMAIVPGLVFMIALFVAAVVCVGQTVNFYRESFFDDAGYLMLTLPVSRGKLLASKVIVSMVWFNIMLGVGALATVIAVYQPMGMTTLRDVFSFLSDIFNFAGVLITYARINGFAFAFITVLFFTPTLTNSTFFGWYVNRGVAFIVSLAYTISGAWLVAMLMTRHRNWVNHTGLIENRVYHDGELFTSYDHWGEMVSEVGIRIGRIPIMGGAYYIDIFLWAALLGFAGLALTATYFMLRRTISLQ